METTYTQESESDNATCSTAGEWSYVALTIIVSTVSIIISIWTIHKYRKDHLFKLEHHTPSPNYLYRSCIAFYIVCIIYMLSVIIGNLLKCINNDGYLIMAQVAILTYIIHWGLILAVYLGRLYFVFRDSALQVPTKHLWYFTLLSVVLILSIIGVQIIKAMIYDYAMIILGWVLSFSAVATLSLVVCSMFINKLRQV